MMELYYSQEKDESVLKVYHNLWRDESVENIGKACRKYMSTGKNEFFPKAGDILDIIKSWQQPPGSIESRAQHQWRLVMAEVKSLGFHRGPPAFDDAITNTVVRNQFTWAGLCSLEIDKLNWAEKRFCESYELATEVDSDHLMLEAKMPEVKKLISGIGDIDGRKKV